MRLKAEYLRQFLRDSHGAVTVDYVILAAAVTAVTLASTDVIQNGMRSLAGTVDSELKGEAPGSGHAMTYSDGFDNGSQGWSGTSSANVSGIGNVLGPIGGSNGAPTVSRDFAFEEGTESATFEFDLYAMDSLDNESGIIFVDGQEIGRITSNLGKATFQVADGIDPDAYIIRQTTIDDDVHLGGSSEWRDHHSNIAITVRNPNTNVNVGFGSTANQSTSDESISIDNFTVTTKTAPTTTAPTTTG
ncbi:Flp pilus assembly protein, pilin Flp [Jannaschia faecimaris]|uniref:Flp pilus assembly protein, pilin Flp n=1 Tax=Jannaschia faecimaris TaxID=1244108 RepID=A0A1H3TPS7_9RHOB|nr:hypothetical protein [Jannaschia faecimaris]SDZ51339.1 Flp pilus assembly protein, pilin Flp [Jannaschia faecimaris]